ncbi:mitochondrial carrier domain-containing protein [Syncephalis plumigaleata]|nr:mitochondrial carrier domain-containing protein [Syncephalis plumigaleata]
MRDNLMSQPSSPPPPSPSKEAFTSTAVSNYHYKVVSACAGAVITSLLVTPLDVVKTRLQSQPTTRNKSHKSSGGSSGTCATTKCHAYFERGLSKEYAYRYNHTACQCPSRFPSATLSSSLQHESPLSWLASSTKPSPVSVGMSRPINGTLDGLLTIVRHEGVHTLWRGLVPTLAMALPSTIMYYTGYDQLREVMMESCQQSAHVQAAVPLVAGGAMRAITATIISPMELVRTRMQSYGESRDLQGVLRDIQHRTRKEGIRLLWRGLGPTLWRDVPFSAVYWLGYETIKQRIKQYDQRNSLSMANEFQYAFIAGATSGTIAAIVTTPFDVIKTRVQTYQHSNLHSHSSVKLRQVMRNIVYREGWSGLTRGMVARVAKIAPSCAVMIGTYEFGKRWLTEGGAQHQRE